MTEKAGFQQLTVGIGEGGMTLSTHTNHAVITIPGKFDGIAVEILISPVYMIDALNAAGPGEVTVSYFDPKPSLPNGRRPVLFTNAARPSLTALVMPMNTGAE
jgi:DNA polymerase III sliding clamp (beta) subunit (PCNA family)